MKFLINKTKTCINLCWFLKLTEIPTQPYFHDIAFNLFIAIYEKKKKRIKVNNTVIYLCTKNNSRMKVNSEPVYILYLVIFFFLFFWKIHENNKLTHTESIVLILSKRKRKKKKTITTDTYMMISSSMCKLQKWLANAEESNGKEKQKIR